MSAPRPATSAPWITAGVAGAVLAALLVVYFAFLRPAKDDQHDPAKAAGGLTGTEQQVVVAAGTTAADLLTFRRAHFAADFARALAGTTGDLRDSLKGKKAVTLKAMTSGKFDLGADVTHKALEGTTVGKTKGYLVLVTVNGYRTSSKDEPVQQNLEITMVKVKGKWLASGVTNIGTQ